MDDEELPTTVIHWNYRGFTEFPINRLCGEETEITDIYFKENLISKLPPDIGKLVHLESLYLSGNDITELPREISKLRCLKCLDVSGNRLRRIPEEIGEVRGLKFLILDENELCELPLRVAELRSLRYLSVCDNKLEWLPQRPVYNYHHCEFRFWRNTRLGSIPYSLWYHMFRDQQTRSLNIGCLTIPKYQHSSANGRCRIKLSQNSRKWDTEIDCSRYKYVINNELIPPSLFEICRRKFYEMLSATASKLSSDNISIYSDIHNTKNSNVTQLEDEFEEFNINNGNKDVDLNGNNFAFNINHFYSYEGRSNSYCTTSDIVNKYFDFLPGFIKEDMRNGPLSRCENISCKKPLFDYVIYEFCIGKIILIDNTEDVILSAALCSKACANVWKRGKEVLTWTISVGKEASGPPQ